MVANIKQRHKENIYNRQLNNGKNIKTHITQHWITYKRMTNRIFNRIMVYCCNITGARDHNL